MKLFTKWIYLLLMLAVSPLAQAKGLYDDYKYSSDKSRQKAEGYRKEAEELCQKGEYKKSMELFELEMFYDRHHRSREDLGDAYARGDCNVHSFYLDRVPQQFTPDYVKAANSYENALISFHRLYTEIYKKSEESMKSNTMYYSMNLKLADVYLLGGAIDNSKGSVSKGIKIYEEVANVTDAFFKSSQQSGESDDLFKSRLAAHQGQRGKARYKLAKLHYVGDLARQDDEKAFQWGIKAWQDGNVLGGALAAVVLYKTQEPFQNKKTATELMGKVCDTGKNTQACGWYKDMRANQPLREGSL